MANGDSLVVSHSNDDVVDYGGAYRTVRGFSRAVFRFSPLSDTQCRGTFVQYLDVGGRIPSSVMVQQVPTQLLVLGEVMEVFKRDDEIDEAERRELARVVKDEPQVYTADENSLLSRVQGKHEALKDEDFEELEWPDHLVKMELNLQGGKAGVGRATTVLDAEIEECVAWELALVSRGQLKCRAYTRLWWP